MKKTIPAKEKSMKVVMFRLQSVFLAAAVV